MLRARFLRANGKERPQLKSQEGFENLTVSTPSPALPDLLLHPGWHLSFLLLARCASPRLCPKQVLGWKGLFPPRGNGPPAWAAAEEPLSAQTEPWGTCWARTLHLLRCVPKQPRCRVQGRVSARPGGCRTQPLGQAEGFDTALPAPPGPDSLERRRRCQVWGDASWQPWLPVPPPRGLWTSEMFSSSHVLSWGRPGTAGKGGTVTTELSPASPEPVLPREVHSPAGRLSSLLPRIAAGLCPGASSIPNGPTLAQSSPGGCTTLGLRWERRKQEFPICVTAVQHRVLWGASLGAPSPPDPWPPLPPPARPVAAGDMENDGALCAPPAPAQRSRARHWRRRATICLYMGKARRPC